MISNWRAGLGDLLQQRNQRTGVADLLFVNQDEAVVEFADLIVFVGDEVRREIAALELHPFDEFDLGCDMAGLLRR